MLKLQLENADLKKQLMEKSNPTVLAFSEGFAADAKHMLVNGGWVYLSNVYVCIHFLKDVSLHSFGPEEETEQRHMIRRHERQVSGTAVVCVTTFLLFGPPLTIVMYRVAGKIYDTSEYRLDSAEERSGCTTCNNTIRLCTKYSTLQRRQDVRTVMNVNADALNFRSGGFTAWRCSKYCRPLVM